MNSDCILSSDVELKIFQIYYREEQALSLDPAFVPYNNCDKLTDYYELSVFQDLSKSYVVKNVSRWGALSWKFNHKTGIHGSDFIAYISSKPDVDVFYMNPFPYIEALFPTPWSHGEVAHSNFLNIVSCCFDAANIERSEIFKLSYSLDYSSCNYFVGNSLFWDNYLSFIEKFLFSINANLSKDVLSVVSSNMADPLNSHNGAPYFPFIIERLFGLFMKTAGKNLLYEKITNNIGEIKMSEHLLELRKAKDIAIMTKSNAVLDCWQKGRSEYFQKNFSKSWCDTHLEKIMNVPIIF
jgi:hypothetical protein